MPVPELYSLTVRLGLVWFFGENSSFGAPEAPVTGSFEFELEIIDSSGPGWNLTVPFTVTD